MTRYNKYIKYNGPILEAYNKTNSTNLILVDGGASGLLPEPFNYSKSVINAIRFEPRDVSTVLKSNTDIYIDGGLWNKDTYKILHLAYDPSTSSILKPNNKFLKIFCDNFGISKRKTVSKIKVRLRSIDSCVQNKEIPLPNFIKLDVHSSELQALQGASKSLKNCIGLLVETWHSEVHSKQGLSHETEQFAIKNGFEVWDIVCAAKWKIKHKDKINSSDRARYIGSEILFIKKNIDKHLRLKMSLVLAMFGFYNASKNYLNCSRMEDKLLYSAINKVQQSIKKDPVFIIKQIILKFINFFI